MWPFKKREDWRRTNDSSRWLTFDEAGHYVYQRECEKWVRFPDGAEEWRPHPGRYTRVINKADR